MKATGLALCLVFTMGIASIGCGSLAEQSTARSDQDSSSTVGVKGRDLISYIGAQQKEHVRESTGIYAYQCFTEVDLRRFRGDSVHLKVAREAKRSPRFRAIVAHLGTLPDAERKALLVEGRGVGHPTWAQLGRITTDGSGQTEAGQTAEGLIAEALVHMAEQMLVEVDH